MNEITRSFVTGQTNDAGVEKQAIAWLEDPLGHYGHSNTRIHSVPREEAAAVQLVALNLRLEQRRAQIPVLAKLADGQGIGRVTSLDDAAPLLFTHDVYKSYPVSLLAKSRFDQLTKWLDRLTSHDLSEVEASGCASIDEWLTLLQHETPLDVATSSGTSGTLSFFPKSQRDYRLSVTDLRIQAGQEFGEEPKDDDLDGKIHAVSPLYRDGHSTVGRLAHYFLDIFCRGDETYLHTAFPFKISADLMWLAARIRAAQAKGDGSRVDVPESLLARRGEWENLQGNMAAHQTAFLTTVVETLRGQRVFALGLTNLFYEVARKGLEQGLRGDFSPDSAIMGGGGSKGTNLPGNADDVIRQFFGISRLRNGYGMTEITSFLLSCEQRHHHLHPWVIPMVLDHDSGQPLPRSGVQTGRAGFIDLASDGAWGGVVSGDKVTIDYTPCACGRSTPHIHPKIERFSDISGGDDKITCAATPAAQADALDYLNAL